MSGKSLKEYGIQKECAICRAKFLTLSDTKETCSDKCKYELKQLNRKIDGEEGIDFITCPMCGKQMKELASHYKRYHKEEIPPEITKCQKIRDNLRGMNNPSYQHGGRFSPFSKKFIHFVSEEKRKDSLKKQGETRKKNGTNPFTREHYSSDVEFSKAQTRDLDYFVKIYGEEEGKKRHSAKTEKWLNSYKKQNYSKISQELFINLMNEYSGDVFFATYEREEMKAYKNKEFRIMIEGRGMLLDFVDIKTKRVIEFDGDYWHSDAKVNPIREKERETLLKSEGYLLLRIREQDYKKDKQGTIDKCIQFLTE